MHMKYNLPTFIGKSNSTLSIHQWIRKVGIAAKFQNWNDKQQTCMAQLSLEGLALTWLDTIQEDDMPWPAFKEKITVRFTRFTEDPQKIIDKLTTRRQQHNEDVRTFTHDYTNLLAQSWSYWQWLQWHSWASSNQRLSKCLGPSTEAKALFEAS